VNDLLSRRLQTIVSRNFGFKTPYQARQAVIHGHIMIGDRKVNIPSYIVKLEEEKNIHFSPESKIPDILQSTKKIENPPEVDEDVKSQLSETKETST
jgi:small subunit ribosomal protein S4